MGRTRVLIGFLLVAVMVAWIVTFFFYNRLPLRIPVHFDFDGSYSLGERWTFFIYPVVSTVAAALMLLVYPFRRIFRFPGRKLIKDLPREFSEPVYQRYYQISVMAVIFATMVLTFIQSNVALIATGRSVAFNTTPLFGVLAIFAIYFLYSTYTLWRMAKAIAAHYEEWKERGGGDG